MSQLTDAVEYVLGKPCRASNEQGSIHIHVFTFVYINMKN